MAVMYQNGQGVNQNLKKTAYWLQMAAKQNHIKAQAKLGALFVNGQGVEASDTQAVYWFAKAAEQGHSGAQNNLALMYENGEGVEIDFDKALSLYQQADTPWSRVRIDKLNQRMTCVNSAQTRLFYTKLKCAQRNVLMKAIKDAGAKVEQEDKTNWGDSYLTPSKRFGKGSLYVAYTLEDQFALARYTFNNDNGEVSIEQIKAVVASSYGKPHVVHHINAAGQQSFQWDLADGIEVQLSQKLGVNDIILQYRDPNNFAQMKAAQEKQRLALMEQQYQFNASQL